MELLFAILASLTLAYISYTLVDSIIGFKQLKKLTEQMPIPFSELPKITIIFSALNEENKIEEALLSLVNLTYPDLEIIAVNDRSTDTTPQILDKLQSQYPILQVLHIKKLPENWFGKNHALHQASKRAQGDWLLFTDADVIMKTDTLTKAISYVKNNNLDHLTIYEHNRRDSFWLKVCLLGNYITYSMVMKPWRIRHAKSKKSLGHGAFNLVNKTAYQNCDGHQAIAMECLDDISLGALLKNNGYRQDTVDGRDYIEREWYHSLSDMVRGMKKNSFAYYNYKLLPMLRDAIFALTFYVWPLFAVIFFSGVVCYLNLLVILITLGTTFCVVKQFRLEKKYIFFYPISIAILVYTIVNSAYATYRNKGVIWRGTHYSLNTLKAQLIQKNPG
jgi:cellulose synthase/poly-beta-1,6-N-acetylglucosamine synthase-like glycosyltransferase